MSSLSIITIVRGRRKYLTNMVESLCMAAAYSRREAHQTQLVVVVMDSDSISVRENVGCEKCINIQTIRMLEHSHLPLSAARNMGAKYATHDNLVFLDVDCIVKESFFKAIPDNFANDNVIMLYPRYLPYLPLRGLTGEVAKDSVEHPARKILSKHSDTVPHKHFWSLAFMLTKQTFNRIGGFDETYIGYGAEDTDFAMAMKKHNVPLVQGDVEIYHQYHIKVTPPLHHLEDIVSNANRFQSKWGFLPMYRTLLAFKALGLINLTTQASIIALPSQQDIAKAVSLKAY